MCTVSAGVGAQLVWTVTIGGQSSVHPTTSYAPPIIRTLLIDGDNSVEALSSVSTTGGHTLSIRGSGFGPSGADIPLLVTASTTFTTLNGQTLTRTLAVPSCVVVADDDVQCDLPPGTGAGYRWVVVVAGQESAPSTVPFAFAPPVVTAVDASPTTALPTTGGVTVTVTGTGFGVDAGVVEVTWNGNAVTGVRVSVPDTQLQFQALPGAGASIALAVRVAGQIAASDAHVLANTLSYRPPVVTSLSLVRVDANSGVPVMDCSVIDNGGYPVRSGGNATLVLTGSDFGVGAAVAVTVRGVDCVVVRASPVQLVCVTLLCEGNCVESVHHWVCVGVPGRECTESVSVSGTV